MVNNDLVSIVLPSYNGNKYLKDAINSVLTQTYCNWELILVDDCSLDDTWMVMKGYQENYPDRVRCIHHRNNQRLPAALNTGFSASKGRYLTWTSDDNWYKPTAIEEMVNYLEENQKVGLVYCDHSIINEHEEIFSVNVMAPEALMFKSMVGPCFLYRREVYEEIGQYSEKHFLAEDYEYFVRVAQKFEIQPLHKDLYCYRFHNNSLSSTRSKDVARVIDEIKLENAHKLPFKVASQVKSEGYHQLYIRFSKRRQVINTIKAYCLMVRYNPLKARYFKWLIKSLLPPNEKQ